MYIVSPDANGYSLHQGLIKLHGLIWIGNNSALCGGINPYTLTTRLGLGDFVHQETVRGLIQLLGVSHKETRREDQARFLLVKIEIDIALSMAIVTD